LGSNVGNWDKNEIREGEKVEKVEKVEKMQKMKKAKRKLND